MDKQHQHRVSLGQGRQATVTMPAGYNMQQRDIQHQVPVPPQNQHQVFGSGQQYLRHQVPSLNTQTVTSQFQQQPVVTPQVQGYGNSELVQGSLATLGTAMNW